MDTGFFAAGLLVLREGFEALLVIAALGAYLVKAGEAKRLPALYGGALSAVAASVVAAWGFSHFNNGMHDDRLEGVVLLAASALLFYVSGWLFVRQDPKHWQQFLKKKADRAMANGTAWAFAALAFFAVFREGAETVLFLNALISTEGGWTGSVVAGAFAAMAVLAALFVVIEKLAVKLPLRAVFLVTSAFLFVMGLDFFGSGIHELQEVGVLGYDDSPLAGWMGEADEMNLTWQAVIPQALIVLAAAAGSVWVMRKKA